MTTKPLYIALMCIAAVALGVAVWLARTELFGGQASKEALASAGLFPQTNRDVKADPLLRSPLPPQPADPGPVSQFIETVRAYPDSLGWNRTARAPVKRDSTARLLLDDAQIASIRSRLNLTLKQQRYWPRLETSLRGAMRQLYDYQKRGRALGETFDMDTREVQNLIDASKEFLALLREDQKSELMALARIAGMQSLFAELTSTPDPPKRVD